MIANNISNVILTEFQENAWLSTIENYFLYGRFDPMDIVFLILGALAAYLTITFLHKRDNKNSAPGH